MREKGSGREGGEEGDGTGSGRPPKEGLASLLEEDSADVSQSLGLSSMVVMKGGTSNFASSPEAEIHRSVCQIFDAPLPSTSSCVFPFINSLGRIDYPEVENYVLERLETLEEEVGEAILDLSAEGKIGPPIVVMPRSGFSGEIRFEGGPYEGAGLVLESQSNFCSARANACVYKGRWMYEATLGTAGIQQIGWATLDCPFTNEEGVGDGIDSYAYDGKRMKKWGGGDERYGQAWVPGDVIGCCIDLDSAEVSFFRNGTPLGVAFSGIRTLDKGLGYFPALSLSHGEKCELNFGSRPFKHPVKGFLAMQAPPAGLTAARKNRHFDKNLNPASAPVRSAVTQARYLFACFQRLIQLGTGRDSSSSAQLLHRPLPLPNEDVVLMAALLFRYLGPLLLVDAHPMETQRAIARIGGEVPVRGGYVVWATGLPFLLDVYRRADPHDSLALHDALNLLLLGLDPHELEAFVPAVFDALAYHSRTAVLMPTELPFSGSYPYVALACQLAKRPEVLAMWWAAEGFNASLEGLLTRKALNKDDSEALLPVVWWPGCREDGSSESRMKTAVSSLNAHVTKIEDLQFELGRMLLAFVPPQTISGSPLPVSTGGIFGPFLRNLVRKNRGSNRNIPPPGLSEPSVLIAAYFILLRMLWAGISPRKRVGTGRDRSVDDCDISAKREISRHAFLQRSGKRNFKVRRFTMHDPYNLDLPRLGGTFSHIRKTFPLDFRAEEDFCDIQWDDAERDTEGEEEFEGGRNEEEERSEWRGRGGVGGAERRRRIEEEMSGHGRNFDFAMEIMEAATHQPVDDNVLRKRLWRIGEDGEGGEEEEEEKEEEVEFRRQQEEMLVDMMVLLYHQRVGAAYKQIAAETQAQMSVIAQLDEADSRMRVLAESIARGGGGGMGQEEGEHLAAAFSEVQQLQHLKEIRHVCREDVMENVRNCIWLRLGMVDQWKLEAMFSSCVCLVSLLQAASKRKNIFLYIPEIYVETMVEMFHAFRRSEPPCIPPAGLFQRGLSSLISFLVTHFTDVRIANADVRELLLQAISILLQYPHYVRAFERSPDACAHLPPALLTAFDQRFWIPVSHMLLRLCLRSPFGGPKSLPALSSSRVDLPSPTFQELILETCEKKPELLEAFLNRLLNTLNWTLTEFSVALNDIPAIFLPRQIAEQQLKKCGVMFELSCNLERILEFLCLTMPHLFLAQSAPALINRQRLCELFLFVLSHTTIGPDANKFDSLLEGRLHSQLTDKISRTMILAPLVGIAINLFEASSSAPSSAPSPSSFPSPSSVALCSDSDFAQSLVATDSSPASLAAFQYLPTYDWANAFKDDPASLVRLPSLLSFVERVEEEFTASRKKEEEEERAAEEAKEKKGENTSSSDDEDSGLCSICYSATVDMLFSPCNHTSCQRCVSRHFLNSRKCFFCNTEIESTRPLAQLPQEKGTASTEMDKKWEDEEMVISQMETD